MHSKKKILAVIVSALLVVGLIPIVSFAAEIKPDVSWYTKDTSASEYVLQNPAQVLGFTQLVNGEATDSAGNAIPAQTFAGKTIKLAAGKTFNFSSNEIAPAGGTGSTSFDGTFDGQGATLDNFKLRTSANENIGFIGKAGSDSVIKNVKIGSRADLTISRGVKSKAQLKYIGSLVGYSAGSVYNCETAATITIESAVVQQSAEDPAVVEQVGVLAGVVAFNLEDCTNTGTLTITASSAPAKAYNESTLVMAVGGVVGSVGAPSLIGTPSESSQHGVVKNCKNTGMLRIDTPSENGVDRFNNTVYAESAQVGGVAGYSRSSMYNCSNTGYIRAENGNSVGGVVGSLRGTADIGSQSNYTDEGYDDGTETDPIVVQNCDNSAIIYARSAPGGIAGHAGTYTTIKGCINTKDAMVIGNRWNKPCPGGIVGRTYATVCYCANFGTVASATWKDESTHELSLGAGYYVSGIAGMTLYYTKTDEVTGAEVRTTPLSEVYACYNAGQITAVANNRQRLITGNNEGNTHDCLGLQGTSDTSNMVYGDEESETEASGTASNNKVITSEELRASSSVEFLNALNDSDGWDVYWTCSDGTDSSALNAGYPILDRQITWEASDITGAVVSWAANAEYTGNASTPKATVNLPTKDGSVTLVQGVDFKVVPQTDAIEVTSEGEHPYTAHIEGIGKYTGSATQTFAYGIDKGDLTNCSVSISSHTYNMLVQSPTYDDITVLNSLRNEVASDEYTFELAYPEGVTEARNARAYDVIIKASDTSTHFYGQLKGTWRITPASLMTDVEIGDLVYQGTSYTWRSSTDQAEEDYPVFDYTGYAIKPTVEKVTFNGATLTEGVDYKLVYGNTMVDDNSSEVSSDTNNMGAAGKTTLGCVTVTKTVTSNFTNYDNMFIKIADRSEKLNLADAAVSAPEVIYDGSAQTPVVLTYGGSVLEEGVAYDITYKNNIEAGTASFTATGKGRFIGSISGTFDIVKSALYEISYDYATDGTAAVTGVVYKGSRDSFDLVIPSSVEKDGVTYTVTSIAAGAFGGMSRDDFLDSPANVSKLKLASVSLPATLKTIGDYAFGSAATGITPSLSAITFEAPSQLTSIGEGAFRYCKNLSSFSFPESVDVIGKDAFKNCFNLAALLFDTTDATKPSSIADTAFEGLGALERSVGVYASSDASTVQQLIADNAASDEDGKNGGRNFVHASNYKGNLADAVIDAIASVPYNYGKEIKPSVVVRMGDVVLKQGVSADYTVSYANNVSAGTATVTVHGTVQSGYVGTASATFEITPRDISTAFVADVDIQAYTGNPVIPELKVTYAGYKLVAGEQYSVMCTNNTDIGTATIDIYGVRSFSGHITKTFKIGAALNVYAGESRYDTSGRIVSGEMTLAEDEPYTGVIVATGENYADALAASGLSGLLDYPIVLVGADGMSDETKDTLQAMRDANGVGLDVIVVGGTSAVGTWTEKQLLKYDNDASVKRLAGETRYETARAIYDYGAGIGDGWDSEGYAIIATGANYADALAISPYAAKHAAPVMLVDGSDATSASVTSAKEIIAGYTHAIVLGGSAAVNDVVANELKGAMTKVDSWERLGGNTRFETSTLIAQWELKHGMQMQNVGFATGANFPDALASGYLLGKYNAVLLLVDNTGENNTSLYGFLRANRSGVKMANVFGGDAAVSADMRTRIAQELGWGSLYVTANK